MTMQELNSIFDIKKEIKDYREKIRELEEYAESTTAKLTGLPNGGGVNDKVGTNAADIAQYRCFLESAIAQKIQTEFRITQYIESVTDAQLRRIMYLRFVKRKTWQKVADEIGGNNTEDSVRKRCTRYVQKSQTMSDMSVLRVV